MKEIDESEIIATSENISEENETISNIQNKLNDLENQNDDNKELNKLRCPYCKLNCVFKIDHNNYTIVSDCCNNHHFNSNILEFTKLSSKQQDELIKCSNKGCNNKNLNEMYYCSCNKILCSNCIKNHNEKNKHISIKYIEKDYKCCCSENYNKFFFFCKTCKKNICQNCREEHSSKRHEIFSFLTEKLKSKEKEEIFEKFKNQKLLYEKILKKIDEMLEKTTKKINLLKKTIECYFKINEKIISQYDLKKLNYEMIMNIKNINLNFDRKFDDFLRYDDFKNSLFILVELLEYQDNKEKIMEKKLNINNNNKTEYNFCFNKAIKSFELKEKIISFCELTKKNLLAFGGVNGKVSLFENQGFNKCNLSINYNNKKAVKCLYELNNGLLVTSTDDSFKIYDIIIDKKNITKIKKLQKFNYTQNNNKNKSENKIIELINGQLLTIDGYNIIVFQKSLIDNLYEKTSNINIKEKIFELFEINQNQFIVYTKNNCIKIFNSENHELVSDKNLSQDDNNNLNIISVQKLNENIIILIEKNTIFLYSLLNNQTIKSFGIKEDIGGICKLVDNQFYLYYRRNDVNLTLITKLKCFYNNNELIVQKIQTKSASFDEDIRLMYKLNENLLLLMFKGEDNDAVDIYDENIFENFA